MGREPTTRRDRAGLEFRVTVRKDFGGYRAVDRLPTGDSLLQRAGAGLHIESCSDQIEQITYSSSRQLRIWRKAILINSPADLADFQSRWGEILVNPTSYVSYEYCIKYISDLRAIAKSLGNDKTEALKELSGYGYFQGSFQIDPQNGVFYIQAKSLLQFMRIELWIEYANGRPMQKCRHCGEVFPTGGKRGAARRVDAIYCSASCRVMASRAAVKMRGSC